MKKTFDQICANILGEMVTPTTPNATPGQPQKPQTPVAQQASGQQTPDIKKISADLAKLTDANAIEKLLTGLLNPKTAQQNAAQQA